MSLNKLGNSDKHKTRHLDKIEQRAPVRCVDQSNATGWRDSLDFKFMRKIERLIFVLGVGAREKRVGRIELPS